MATAENYAVMIAKYGGKAKKVGIVRHERSALFLSELPESFVGSGAQACFNSCESVDAVTL